MAGQLPRDVGEKTSWESTSQLADVLKKLNVQLGGDCWSVSESSVYFPLLRLRSLTEFDLLGKIVGFHRVSHTNVP